MVRIRSSSSRFKTLFGVQDMTEGKPMKKLMMFSIPLLIGNFAQQMYNTVDAIVVGQKLGDNALSAVGTSIPIINLMLVLFMGISAGAGILSAQYFGAKDKETLSKVVGTTITLTVASSLIVMVVGYFLSPLLIGLMTPGENSGETYTVFIEEIGPDATRYLQIIFLGILGGGAYNILGGVLRGIGDSVSPLIYLVIASVLNVILDILFINWMNNVSAVAWATIIAQFVSGGLCLWRLLHMKELITINAQTLKPDKTLSKKLAGLGLPSSITTGLFSMSAMMVQSLTNSLGAAVIAANVAIMRVDGFAMMPNFTYGTSATTYVGQNLGAGRMDRIRPGVRDVLKLALITAGILVAAILLFGHNLIRLFTDTDTTIEIGVNGLRWLAAGYIAFAVTSCLHGAMRGLGETKIPMWISIISTIIIRMPLAYLMAALTKSAEWPNGSPVAIYGSLLISWLMSMGMTIFVYLKGKWRRHLDIDALKQP
ncbi:MAG: MATE family efflux transporter [Clostridia bacterium]|nr:MATE family efflux transporter [Clostridia bacterium]